MERRASEPAAIEESPRERGLSRRGRKGSGLAITSLTILYIGTVGGNLMAKPEEFEVIIDKDGRIRLDMRGMSAESYRRIVEVLQETVGPVQEVESEEDDPPSVREYPNLKADSNREEEELKNRHGS